MEPTPLPNDVASIHQDHTIMEDRRTMEDEGTVATVPRPVTPSRHYRLERDGSFGRPRSDSNASSSTDVSNVSLPIRTIGCTTVTTSTESTATTTTTTTMMSTPPHEIPWEIPTPHDPKNGTTTNRDCQPDPWSVPSHTNVLSMEELDQFTLTLFKEEEWEEWERQTSSVNDFAHHHQNHPSIDDRALDGVVVSHPCPPSSFGRHYSNVANALSSDVSSVPVPISMIDFTSTASTVTNIPSHPIPQTIVASHGRNATTEAKTSTILKKPSVVQSKTDLLLLERLDEGVIKLPHAVTPSGSFDCHQYNPSSSYSDIYLDSSPIRALFFTGTSTTGSTKSMLDGKPPYDIPMKIAASHRRKSTPKDGDVAKATRKIHRNSKKQTQARRNDNALTTCSRNDMFLGPIVTYTSKDVLLGRGGLTNNHCGNVRFRAAAAQLRPAYVATTSKIVKRQTAVHLMNMMKEGGARFLEKNPDGSDFFVVDDIVAINKSSQAIREDPEVARIRRNEKRAAKQRKQNI